MQRQCHRRMRFCLLEMKSTFMYVFIEDVSLELSGWNEILRSLLGR